jgi:GNAT superfamily N-acetyltransferase
VSLPDNYAHPSGQLFLATLDGRPAGCVALREIDATYCEMKCMFIYSELHGKGVGRALAGAIVKEARAVGHAFMRLDTSIHQGEAQGFIKALASRLLPLTMSFQKI